MTGACTRPDADRIKAAETFYSKMLFEMFDWSAGNPKARLTLLFKFRDILTRNAFALCAVRIADKFVSGKWRCIRAGRGISRPAARKSRTNFQSDRNLFGARCFGHCLEPKYLSADFSRMENYGKQRRCITFSGFVGLVAVKHVNYNVDERPSLPRHRLFAEKFRYRS